MDLVKSIVEWELLVGQIKLVLEKNTILMAKMLMLENGVSLCLIWKIRNVLFN